MNQPRSTILCAIGSFAAICLLCGAGGNTQDKDFECAGKNDNGMVVFREFPTLRFTDHHVKISGSDIFSRYSYETCIENDTTVSFATSQEVCGSGKSGITSLGASIGSFNKSTGQLEIKGAQGIHGEYQCKPKAKPY